MNPINIEQTTLCACANLRMATRAITQFYEEALRPTGLRATQFTLLATLAQAGPLPISTLAQIQVVNRTTLTRNLQPLERQGLVESTSTDDRRTRLVSLTEQGEWALAEALPLWAEAQAQVVTGLGQDKFNGFLEVLTSTVDITQAR